MSKKSRLISSLLTGFTVAFYFALVLPVQSYLANADSFNYTLGALLGDLCLPLVLTFAGASLALFFLSRWIGQFLHILLLALAVAAFAESGPLSIGLPELNGDFSGYKSLTRAIWDGSILVAIVLIPLCCYRWLRGSATWIALALTVYLGATLFDVKVKSRRPEGMEDFIVPRLVPRTDVVRSAEFSPKRNVIMLILDSISVDACVDAFAADPDLASHFTGFVNYTNNVGMMWPTHMAIPGIFTAKYCESLDELSRYGQSMWMKDSFVKPYLDKDIPTFVNVALTRNGYTNRVKPKGDDALLRPCQPFEEHMLGLYPLTIPELVWFRVLPYFAKESYVSGISFQTNTVPASELDASRLFDDSYLWQELAKKPVNPDLGMTLHVHHVCGGHPPTKFTRDGGAAKSGDRSYEGHVEQCVYAFRQLAKLFDVWKSNGIYDSSVVFILADHSHFYKKPGCEYRYQCDLSCAAYPFLMVKDRMSRQRFSCSHIPTSHAKIARCVERCVEECRINEDGGSLLGTKARSCMEIREGAMRMWDVSEDLAISAFDKKLKENLSVGDLRPLIENETYSFLIQDNLLPPYLLSGGKRGTFNGTSGIDMQLTFKVPEPNVRYDFDFALWLSSGSKSQMRVQLNGGGVTNNISGAGWGRYELIRVASDENGIVKINAKRLGELGSISFEKVRIRKSQVVDVQACIEGRNVKVSFDPAGGKLMDTVRFVKMGGRYGYNVNLYPSDATNNFAVLASVTLSNNVFTVDCDNSKAQRGRRACYYPHAGIVNVRPREVYTYVADIHSFAGKTEWRVGQIAPTNNGVYAALSHGFIGSQNLSGVRRFKTLTGMSHPAKFLDYGYLSVPASERIRGDFRISLFAGNEVTDCNYTYVCPGAALRCRMPYPIREGYLFGGWYYQGDKVESDTRVKESADHTLRAKWIKR